MTIEAYLKSKLAVFVKIKYFLFRSVWAKGNSLTNREHAPKGYISFILASIFWHTEIPCVIRRDGPNQKKNMRNKIFELLTHRIRSVSPDDARGYHSPDARILFMWTVKTRLVFGPYRPEKQICVLKENCKLKFKNKPLSSWAKTYLENLPPRLLSSHCFLPLQKS